MSYERQADALSHSIALSAIAFFLKRAKQRRKRSANNTACLLHVLSWEFVIGILSKLLHLTVEDGAKCAEDEVDKIFVLLGQFPPDHVGEIPPVVGKESGEYDFFWKIARIRDEVGELNAVAAEEVRDEQ